MKDIVVYIHGKNGSAAEAARYRRLFANSDVPKFDYEACTPWEAKEEFALYFESILKSRKSVTIVANSIGAFFAMHALQDMRIKKAGGTIVKEPQDAFWGGYHAYFADPDGYYWEVAWGPCFKFDEDGLLKF